jgi:hypothetical protein
MTGLVYSRGRAVNAKQWLKEIKAPERANAAAIRAAHKAIITEYPEAEPVLSEMTKIICDGLTTDHVLDTLRYISGLVEVSSRMAEGRVDKLINS